MAGDLIAFGGDHHDHFEELAGLVRTDHEPSFWVFGRQLGDQGVCDGMENTSIGGTVTARRGMNLRSE